MAERFSLKDHLFNAETVGQLADEYGAAVPGFDAVLFQKQVLAGFGSRELMARLEWIADCVHAQLRSDFNALADQLEAAMPPPLDPCKTDDDFGQFIHAVPGILAVRHGLEQHRPRAMALLYQATQRFSMEFYIRPFLNRWPAETLAVLRGWADDPNYHVRRLVSEGTRPKLPWAKAVHLGPDQTLPLLDSLHADPTRYVTRSVANHLNDISKTDPTSVLRTLERWRQTGTQDAKELAWMTRHALRTLVKAGHEGALATLGFRADIPVVATLKITSENLRIGDSLIFECTLTASKALPVLVDYRIDFARPGGRRAEKVFKLKQGQAAPDQLSYFSKSHKIKENATTFTWHPGRHRLIIQVNGVDRAEAEFELA